MSSSQPVLLLMTGSMGAGKSVGADFYVEHRGASRWSRTELMKRLAHAIADSIGDPTEILRRIVPDDEDRHELTYSLLDYIATYEPEPGKPRKLYQDITQICQDHDPLCFERELAARIDQAGDAEFCLIDDVRSHAAFEFFSARGYRSVRIDAQELVRRQRMKQRDGYLPPEATFTHPSETELVEVNHDHVIENNEDNPARLYKALDDVLQIARGGQPLVPVDYKRIAVGVMAHLSTAGS
jgi:hypothetical protein